MIKNLQKPITIDQVNKANISTMKIDDLKLSDFVTQQSTLLFKNYFNTELPEFLSKNPATWTEDEEYLEMENILRQVEVVNDVAERGIALIKNYNGILTNQEEEKQLLLQVVEHHYRAFPTLTKTNIMSGLKL